MQWNLQFTIYLTTSQLNLHLKFDEELLVPKIAMVGPVKMETQTKNQKTMV